MKGHVIGHIKITRHTALNERIYMALDILR